ncbi:Sporulation related domain-containing protein [Roseivivax lentus]|uniref:Sporulation related domain-containing protein n=1 Tax=Roseivivax lentus TaxID=633194 RepID=A0A1N7NZ17_9RHOB|nr:SPOR domain-containing protein [Roseivivax lentus]SIT03570.1 Sporulation related domain-containing protein [Roseivivax lentus]
MRYHTRLNGRAAVLGAALLALGACDSVNMPGFLQAQPSGGDGAEQSVTRGATTERDVEAPEVFEVREAGLWDGRPSLGGVWVAHPDVTEPERVIIRNLSNGQFVIGALFKRERETPGPRLQVSSDAAAAIGMLAGAPTNLHVVALRREEVAAPAPETAVASDGSAVTGGEAMSAAGEIEASTLDPVAASAAAVLDAAPGAPTGAAPAPVPVETAAAPAPAPRPTPAPAPSSGSLARPFVQIGIFSVEQNAENTATAMRQAGMVPTVKKQSASGKTFWRVVVGPAQSKSEIDALLEKIRAEGFTDAYAVSN